MWCGVWEGGGKVNAFKAYRKLTSALFSFPLSSTERMIEADPMILDSKVINKLCLTVY